MLGDGNGVEWSGMEMDWNGNGMDGNGMEVPFVFWHILQCGNLIHGRTENK